jgi:hypothetical protein
VSFCLLQSTLKAKLKPLQWKDIIDGSDTVWPDLKEKQNVIAKPNT